MEMALTFISVGVLLFCDLVDVLVNIAAYVGKKVDMVSKNNAILVLDLIKTSSR